MLRDMIVSDIAFEMSEGYSYYWVVFANSIIFTKNLRFIPFSLTSNINPQRVYSFLYLIPKYASEKEN